MSRISTDTTVMPHSFVLRSKMSATSRSICSRRVLSWAMFTAPITSRSVVCAAQYTRRT